MTIQPIDIPSLLHAVTWPLIAVVIFILFQEPLGDVVSVLSKRIHKISLGWVSIELAEFTKINAQAVDADIRELEASLIPRREVSVITRLLRLMQHETWTGF